MILTLEIPFQLVFHPFLHACLLQCLMVIIIIHIADHSTLSSTFIQPEHIDLFNIHYSNSEWFIYAGSIQAALNSNTY